MGYLLDTNVAWRRIQVTDPHHSDIKSAIDTLVEAGEDIYVTPQNFVEFRSVATRPLTANGLGLTSEVATLKGQEVEALFELLPETSAIYPQRRALVDHNSVYGKQVHDTRLVAVMLVHRVTHLLTLNPADFERYSDITVVTP